jgi:hypothetical protein
LDKLELLLAERDRRFWTSKLWSLRRLRIYKRWRHFYWRCLYRYFRLRAMLHIMR